MHTYGNAVISKAGLTMAGPTSGTTPDRPAMVSNPLAPVIIAGPTIENALLQIGNVLVIVAGDTNVFTVGAMDPGGNPLSYQWSFGDGAANEWSPLNTAEHVYTTNYCGPYTAGVTVDNGWAATSSNLTVAVACELGITRMQATLNFANTNADSCSLSATLDLGASYNPVDNQVMLDIGGAQIPFTLDAKGRGVNQFGSCTLGYDESTGLWTLNADLAKGSWQTAWAAYGLVNQTEPKPGAGVTMPVIVLVGNEAFAAEHTMSYTATFNSTARQNSSEKIYPFQSVGPR